MFKFLNKNKEERPLSEKEILSSLEKLKEETKELKEEIERIKKDSEIHFQKMGLVRFNPFSEIGGDQSFSLAILDKNDNGAVITSYYSRENNRVYAKPLKKGKSSYVLTKEEKKAIEKANLS
jgi:hypothetical protein